ncbi:DNA-directed RNA polymerase III RPC8 [Besnoitia besnoiti]|uniref:DNA-directed RNA polymerase III RPC8 n=1 Tax=Besnoitia besnoiti TaxID=94643 RepID=A0A2A9M5F5_BESBE|nr:DNA-directed RNA polymerase III RPC8 [Besnoitia besnoiti]PFH31531.1 DNA-directed RNA polymerase III RPC8 [Besnoitia besnoiti]
MLSRALHPASFMLPQVSISTVSSAASLRAGAALLPSPSPCALLFAPHGAAARAGKSSPPFASARRPVPPPFCSEPPCSASPLVAAHGLKAVVDASPEAHGAETFRLRCGRPAGAPNAQGGQPEMAAARAREANRRGAAGRSRPFLPFGEGGDVDRQKGPLSHGSYAEGFGVVEAADRQSIRLAQHCCCALSLPLSNLLTGDVAEARRRRLARPLRRAFSSSRAASAPPASVSGGTCAAASAPPGSSAALSSSDSPCRASPSPVDKEATFAPVAVPFSRVPGLEVPAPPHVEIRRVVVLDKLTRYELELEQRLGVLRERFLTHGGDTAPAEPAPEAPAYPSQQPGRRASAESGISTCASVCETLPAFGTSRASSAAASPSSALASPSPSFASPSPSFASSSPSFASSVASAPVSSASAFAASSFAAPAAAAAPAESIGPDHERLPAHMRLVEQELRMQLPQAYATHLDHTRNVQELVRQLQEDWGVHTTLIKARSFGKTLENGRRAILKKNASAAFPPDAVIAAGGDGTLLEAASFLAALEETQGPRGGDGFGGQTLNEEVEEAKERDSEGEDCANAGPAGRPAGAPAKGQKPAFSPDGIWLLGFNTDPVRSEGRLCLAYRPPMFRPRSDNALCAQAKNVGAAEDREERTTMIVDEASTTDVEATHAALATDTPSADSRPRASQQDRRHFRATDTECVSPVLSSEDGQRCFQIPTFHPHFLTPRRPSCALPPPPPQAAASASSASLAREGEEASATPSGDGVAGDESEKLRSSRAYVQGVLRYVMDGRSVAICRQRIRLELEYPRSQEEQILQRVEQQRREHIGLMSLLPLERVSAAPPPCAPAAHLKASPSEPCLRGRAFRRGRALADDAAHAGLEPDSEETGVWGAEAGERPPRDAIVRRVLGVSALNDVFVGECDSSRTCYAQVKIDQGEPTRYKSSGFLVATGTGSSAWSFNMSKVRTEQIKAVVDELHRSLALPVDLADAVDWEALRERVNRQLLFHPSMPVMRYFVREPIENSIFTCRGSAGVAHRVEIHVLSPDAMVAIDGLLSFPLPVGVKLVLHISPCDALWTVK